MSADYVWWPAPRRGLVEFDSRKGFGATLLAEGIIGLILALPPVSRATGVAPALALAIVAAHLACVWINGGLQAAAQRSALAFHLQLAMALGYNVGLCVALVLASGDARSPLWAALLLYACVAGASQELEANVVTLLVFVGAPLATIPYFAHRNTAWAIAGPAWSACLCGLVYNIIGSNSARWRAIREELRVRIAELERKELAQDLHDSVGSVLALTRMYGDLIEANLSRPDMLGQLARSLRETTSQGLGDLRGVLEALAPEAARLGELCASLENIGKRMAAPARAEVRVALAAPAEVVLDGPVRLAMVRVFQEALANALRHGKAARIHVEVGVADEKVKFTLRDDGCGFDPAQGRDGGRGLAGMRRRAGALGGTVDIASRSGEGTTIRLELPLRAPEALAP